MNKLNPIAFALLSAFLFGLATPLSELFVSGVSPYMIAALLYLGSAIGMTLIAIFRLKVKQPELLLKDWLWFVGAITFGGIIAPVAFIIGLQNLAAAPASLLLNLEGVFTAFLAWFAFKENFDKRIALGMVLIIASSLILSWQPGYAYCLSGGASFIALACLFWGIDNNLMRKVSSFDPVNLAAIKGWVGGGCNLFIAIIFCSHFPKVSISLSVLCIGFISYGLSFCLFVLALRHLGAARTGAYFSTAPFIGAIVSLFIFGFNTTPQFWLAGCLAAIGVWLHISERHEHLHIHQELEHDHSHIHDQHHQHKHDGTEPPGEPHSHPHKHEHLEHSHRHYPDIHHQHKH